ncbi:MAG: ankyrin repeat domain-containing protein [Verrucomicrobia bacterium]|nr:ankyrin repeat domain-containing protein [Verrucomicrobiota bacterium]
MKHLLLTTIAAVVLVGCVCRKQSPVESIHKAAEVGNIKVVKQHLAAGVDVNEIDTNKMTALHWAAMKGQKKVVALLIVEGANLNAKTSKNLTPLNLADNNFQNDVAELLIANGASEFIY